MICITFWHQQKASDNKNNCVCHLRSMDFLTTFEFKYAHCKFTNSVKRACSSKSSPAYVLVCLDVLRSNSTHVTLNHQSMTRDWWFMKNVLVGIALLIEIPHIPIVSILIRIFDKQHNNQNQKPFHQQQWGWMWELLWRYRFKYV